MPLERSVMIKPQPKIEFAVLDHTAFMRISGRASLLNSVEFRAGVNSLVKRGARHFVLDLTDCPIMDSTFLGVLAGLVIGDAKESTALSVEILNPHQRVMDLLDSLGVIEFFRISQNAQPCTAVFDESISDSERVSAAERSRTCLEAHKVLMDLNPQNVPKFKEVARLLAEDLEKKGQV